MRDERLNYQLSLPFSYNCFLPFLTTHDQGDSRGTDFALMSSGKLDIGKAKIIRTLAARARLLKLRHEQRKEYMIC